MHRRTATTLKGLREPLATTVAVLTEAFHMLEPQSVGSALETRKVFTLDENNFGVYRIRRGHRHYAVEIIR